LRKDFLEGSYRQNEKFHKGNGIDGCILREIARAINPFFLPFGKMLLMNKALFYSLIILLMKIQECQYDLNKLDIQQSNAWLIIF
jgi:hypothetical protein